MVKNSLLRFPISTFNVELSKPSCLKRCLYHVYSLPLQCAQVK